jgi:ABC-2 type transport system permease protein
MGQLAAMVRKDLLRHARQPLGPGLVLSFPLIFAGLIALTFGGASGPPKVRLLVENRDDGLASRLALNALSHERMAAFFDVEMVGPDGLSRIERDEASALLSIPEGFTDAILAGEPVTLGLVRNPAERIRPEIAEQTIRVGVDVLDAGARALRPGLDRLRVAMEGQGWPTTDTVSAVALAFDDNARAVSRFAFPPAIALEVVRPPNESSRPAGSMFSLIFLTMLPGVSVWALFMVADVGMRDLLTEARLGTLRRQLSTPLRGRDLVAGKALSTAALSSISLVLLAGIGAVVAETPVDLPGFVVLSAALVVAVTGFSAAAYGLARTERQGATSVSIVLLVFAFLGGAFVPIESLPASLRTASWFTPIAWGTTGYARLLRDGAGVAEVAPIALGLAALGAALVALGAWRLSAKVRHGVAA